MASLLLAADVLSAQNAELGVVSSPAKAGISARFTGDSGNISEVRLYAEVCDIIRGKYSWPGIRADWHLLFPVATFSGSSTTEISFNAGPGVTAGYVRDRKEEAGVIAGLSGMASLDFRFNVPVTLSLSLSAVCGFHLKSGTTMRFYRNGIYRAWIPALTIKYNF